MTPNYLRKINILNFFNYKVKIPSVRFYRSNLKDTAVVVSDKSHF